MGASARIRHVIVDRDGVLNEEAPAQGYITAPEAWRWIPGAREGLALLARAGIRVSVATNQSGVGRGLMTLRDLDAVHARMYREAEAAGGRIAAVYACPHAPEAGCDCRKPAPGLIRAAIEGSGVPAEQTLVVGDADRDIAAARAAGVGAVLVRTGKGSAAAGALSRHGIPIYDDFHAFARALVAGPEVDGNDRA